MIGKTNIMIDYNLVTLEELEALYEQAEDLNKDLPMVLSKSQTLLEQHLIAERLLHKDYHEIDWLKICKSLREIFDYADLWMHPLEWQDPSLYPDSDGDARLVKEVFMDERFPDVCEIVDYIYEQFVLDFADNPIKIKEDVLEAGLVRGMHEWSRLTWNVKSFWDDGLLADDSIDIEKTKSKYYDFIRLRYNLTLIAEKRSPKRAAELLRMLQKEWSMIKQWKTGFNAMTEEDLAMFEDALKNRFNDLLKAWDNNQLTPQQIALNNRNEPFKYIHYSVVDDKEKDFISKQICNIVSYPKMSQVCDALFELIKDKKILSTIERNCMYEELRRFGLPDSNTQGFSDKNFYSYYHTK